jgi:DNA polymerase III alpha subunit
MLAARDLAGFSIREAEHLRKALGRSDTPQRLRALAGAFPAAAPTRRRLPGGAATAWT